MSHPLGVAFFPPLLCLRALRGMFRRDWQVLREKAVGLWDLLIGGTEQ